MRRITTFLAAAAAIAFMAAPALAVNGSIWSWKPGDMFSKNHSVTGIGTADAYLTPTGMGQLGPGTEGVVMPSYRAGVGFLRMWYSGMSWWGPPFEVYPRGVRTFRADSTGIDVAGKAVVSDSVRITGLAQNGTTLGLSTGNLVVADGDIFIGTVGGSAVADELKFGDTIGHVKAIAPTGELQFGAGNRNGDLVLENDGDFRFDLGNVFLKNNKALRWKDSGGTIDHPVVRVDSVNVLRIQPPSGGSVDVMGADGVLRGRFFGTGGLSMTGTNAQYQLSGFRILQDQTNMRGIIQKSTAADGSAGIAFKDSSNTTNEAVMWPGGTLSVPRLGPISGVQTGGAIRYVDGVKFALTIDGIQAAIDDLPSQGGTVVLPGGNFTGTATLYTPCDRPVHIRGQGYGTGAGGKGTTISNSSGRDVLRLRGDYSSVEDLSLICTGAPAAPEEMSGRGLTIGRRDTTDVHPAPGTSGTEFALGGSGAGRNFLVRNVRIHQAGGWGLYIGGCGKMSDGVTDERGLTCAGTFALWSRFENVIVTGSAKYGDVFIGKNNTTLTFQDCIFGLVTGKSGNDAYYTYIREASAIRFNDCTWEGFNGGTRSWFYTYNARNVDLLNPWFEEDGGDTYASAPNWFVEMDGSGIGGVIQTARFSRMDTDAAGRPRLMKFTDHNNVTIVNPTATINTNAISAGVWIEQNHIDLGGGTNWNMVVVGKGMLIDAGGGSYMVQYANVPRTGTMISDDALKAPSRSTPQIADVLRQMTEQGQIIYNDDIANDAGNIECLQYYGAGQQAGMRLINNAPTMTRAQRDAYAGWRQGDIIMISNPTVAGREFQVRRAGAWYWITTTVNVAGD